MQWILCSERMPSVEEIRRNNLFICSNGINTVVRSYSFRLNGFIIQVRGKDSKDRSVIAWMPLPPPYKPADPEHTTFV